MKKNLALLFFAVLVTVAANAAEMISQVRLLSMINVPQTREAQASFEGLKPEALEFGLGNAVLIGAVEYQALAEPNTRVTIKWHSVGINNMGGQASQPLPKPLISQFTMDTKRLDPNTLLSVRGDLDQVAEAFLALKNRLAKSTPRDLVSRKETTKVGTNNDKANANELSPVGSGSASGGNLSNAPYSSSSDQNKIQTDMTVTTWEDCAPRIDRAGGFVYPQQRRIDKGQTTGKLMGTGSCEDRGDPAAIKTVYGGACADVVDIAQKKTFQQYAMSATLAGKQIDVALCTADFAKFYPITGVPATCTWRHDFVNGVSIAQEELQYTDSTGTIKKVRDCGDSSQSYTQYKTANTCSPTVDGPNALVIINSRTAFKDGNGAEQYATACAPDTAQRFPVKEAFCSPKYEHDFVNHVSYYITSTYYVDAGNNTHALSTCTRSASNSFPHIFQTTGCNVTNDDANLMTHWNKLTQINTPTDGVLTVAPCAEVGNPTGYVSIGELRTASDYTSPLSNIYTNGISTSGSWVSGQDPPYDLGTLRKLFPTAIFTGSNNIIKVTSFNDNGISVYGIGTTNPDVRVFAQVTQWNSNIDHLACQHTLSGEFFYRQYLRGDSSTYTSQQINRNNLSVAMTCKIISPFASY